MKFEFFLLNLILIGINAQEEIKITNNWSLFNIPNNINISNVTLPMSVTTALRLRNQIDDPLFRFNDVKLRWIVMDDNWIFENKFQIDNNIDLNNTIISLVFDSIDTIASVYLNEKFVLYASNQFLSYELFDIGSSLIFGTNNLQIRFLSPVKQANYASKIYPYYLPVECPVDVQNGECHVNMLRKQQCSFSWDWGPAFAPIGINGDVKLVIIDNFDFNFSLSVYNTDNSLKNWLIDTDIRIINLKSNFITIRIKINELMLDYSESFSIKNNKNEINLKILLEDKYNIKLWFPNGYGDQKVYDLSIEVSNMNKNVIKHQTIGFRSVELIQEKIDPQTEGLSFYFKINGIPIFLKGSNWIPANSFQELITDDYLNWLLESAKEANMNVLRVWGGGIYEQNKFYELADKFGILIWQDFMFACSLYPTNSDYLNNVKSEIVYQLNRLKHHPSIIIWSGNNENKTIINLGLMK